MIVDKAWRLIVAASATREGVRGKQFRMSHVTADLIQTERGQDVKPIRLYGVPIVLDGFMRRGDIELEGR